MTEFNTNNALETKKRIAWATTQPINALGRAFLPSDAAVDELGNIICYSHYGRHGSQYGWDIDHRHPKALSGTDHPGNLRALSCRMNRGMGALLGNALQKLK